MAAKKNKKGEKKGGKKKLLLISLLIVVILVAALIGFLLLNINFIVKTAIEKGGSQATKTAVLVEGVQISLKEGSCSIENLTVGNPEGFELPHAFSLGEIGVDIDLKSLTGDEIGIEDIRVRSPEIYLEINGDRKNNMIEIKNNLPKGSSSPPEKTTNADVKKPGKEPRLFIGRILFEKGKILAKVVPLNNKEYQLAMGKIEMRNLRGTPTQIAGQIVNRLSKQALEEVKKSGVGQTVEKEVNKAVDKAKTQLDELKNKLLK